MDGISSHFAIGYTKQSKASPNQLAYSNKIWSQNKFKRAAPYKPLIGNYGIDNLTIANNATRKVNNSFSTTSSEYSWIKPVKNN